MWHKSILLLVFLSVLGGISAQLRVESPQPTLLLLDGEDEPEAARKPATELCYFEVPSQKMPDLKQAFLGPVQLPQTGQKRNEFLKYRQHLAFFCRVEVKIDKAVKMPFRFRLGSVDYVDYLEGKRDLN